MESLRLPSHPSELTDDIGVAGKADTSYVDAQLAGKANASHTHAIADTTGLQAALDGKGTAVAVIGAQATADTALTLAYDALAADDNLSDLGDAATARTNLGLGSAATYDVGTGEGEIPVLGPSGKLSQSLLPGVALTDTFVVGNQVSMLALNAQTGDVAVRTDLNKSFILKGSDPTVPADWQELLTPTDSVSSVNGMSGAVTLTTTNVSEGTNQYFTNARAVTALSSTLAGYLPLAGGTVSGAVAISSTGSVSATSADMGSGAAVVTFGRGDGGDKAGLFDSDGQPVASKSQAGHYSYGGGAIHYYPSDGTLYLPYTRFIGGVAFDSSTLSMNGNPIYMYGGSLYMGDGGGFSGGNINMDGGAILGADGIATDGLTSTSGGGIVVGDTLNMNGGTIDSVFAIVGAFGSSPVEFGTGISLLGSVFNLGNGTGTGGGTINMDGGAILMNGGSIYDCQDVRIKQGGSVKMYDDNGVLWVIRVTTSGTLDIYQDV